MSPSTTATHWQSLQLNLPVVPIHDLVVKDTDLVAATHGRSFWILDDLTPLHAFSDEIRQSAAHLFAPRAAIRFASESFRGAPVPGLVNYGRTGAWVVAFDQVTRPGGEKEVRTLDAGQNPHDGVYVTYYLRDKPEGELTLSFLDAEDHEIISFSSAEQKEPTSIAGDPRARTDPPQRERPATKAPNDVGFNRFYWDMRYPAAHPVNGYVTRSGVVAGPVVPPGTYHVRLTVGDQTFTQSFAIHHDPRIGATQADLETQFALLMQIRDTLSQAHDAINTAQNLRLQVEAWERRAEGQPEADELRRTAATLKEQLSAAEGELLQTAATEDDDTLRYPVKLNIKLAALFDSVSSADAAPTHQAQEVYAALAQRVEAQLARLRELIERDVAAFNALIFATHAFPRFRLIVRCQENNSEGDLHAHILATRRGLPADRDRRRTRRHPRLCPGRRGMGFDHILAYDHVLGADTRTRPGWAGPYTSETMFHEVLTLFAYLAAITERVELVTGILILPQRQTVLVAKQAAEVDVLSGGRFRLGIGVGWNPVEFEALNEDFSNRGARSAEQIQVLRALWTQPVVDFAGKWHHIKAAGINPLPVRRPIPIWLGGQADQTLRRTAKARRRVDATDAARRRGARADRDAAPLHARGRPA